MMSVVRGRRGPPPVPLLLLSRVCCIRRRQVVLRDISMTVHPGTAMVLTGPNGSGKSTFLRLLAGFIPPSAGNILWQGNDITTPGMYDLYKVNLSLMTAKDAIKPLTTVFENVNFWEILEGGDGGRAIPALHRVGLRYVVEEKASVLSMGQRRRLQMARLLAIPRKIWLLDEPSVGLDAEGVALLEEMMQEHREQGGVVFLATHVPIFLQDAMQLRFPSREHIPTFD